MRAVRASNPTLLVGLGAFGAAVAEQAWSGESGPDPDPAADTGAGIDPGAGAAVGAAAGAVGESGERGDGAGQPGLELVVDAGADGIDVDAVVDAVERACRRLLDLGHFVATTEATDARGPRLDVLVIGDLGEAPVARGLAGVLDALALRLRTRFRPILGVGEGSLAVCALALVPRDADGARIAAAVSALDALANHADASRRPRARLYLVEDQSGKYLLSRAELARSFTAFLHLLVFSGLRADSAFRGLVEHAGDHDAPFATFVCATLEVRMQVIHELCALALAGELLACYQDEPPPLAEIASEAEGVVPDTTMVEARLWQEGERSLEAYLEPPAISVPRIDWTDTPEDVVERKLGPMWRIETERAIEGFRERVERLQMDRLAEQIERNGTALVADSLDTLRARVRGELAAGPRGLARALAVARYAAATARGRCEAVRARIDAPNLGRFPALPLADLLADVHEAAAAWPRHTPARMPLFAAVAGASGSLAAAGMVHLGAETLGWPLPWWACGILGAALVVPGLVYDLWRHRKRHHNWLGHARDALDQAVERHVQRDMVAYFRNRLAYTRLLWVYRVYRRLAEHLEAVVAALERARATVAETRRMLAARAHAQATRLAERSSDKAGAGGILYHSLLGPEVVRRLYAHVGPADAGSAAARFHAELTGHARASASATEPGSSRAAAGSGAAVLRGASSRAPADSRDVTDSRDADGAVDLLDAPFADPERVLDFCRRELDVLRDTSPFDPDLPPLAEAATAAVRAHLALLARKLSPPLELVQSAVRDTPAARHVVVASVAARAVIEETLTSLDQIWQVRALSSDPRRVHLLIERGALPLAAVARVVSVPPEAPAAAPAGAGPDGEPKAQAAAPGAAAEEPRA